MAVHLSRARTRPWYEPQIQHANVVKGDQSIPGGPPRGLENLCAGAAAGLHSRTRPRDRPLPPRHGRTPRALGASWTCHPPCAEGELLDTVCASSNMCMSPQREEQQHVPESLVLQNNTKMQQQLDTLSLKELLSTTMLEESSITAMPSCSPQAEAVACKTIEVFPPSSRAYPRPPISARKPPGWPMEFYIRTDQGGSIHIYPHVGGPFQCLQEAENAIDHHLDNLRDPTMCDESLRKLPLMEGAIKKALYWPDGTRNCLQSNVTDKSCNPRHQLVQALLDEYSEDHNLDNAYELKDVVCYQSICKGPICEGYWYYHINFTAKIKEYDDFDCGINNLFFAEVKCVNKDGDHVGYELSCFRMVKPNDNGHCYGCMRNGCVDLKHPQEVDVFDGGSSGVFLPFGANHNRGWSHSHINSEEDKMKAEEARMTAEEDKMKAEEARMTAEEDRIRHIFECLGDPLFLEKLERKCNNSFMVGTWLVQIPNSISDRSEAKVQHPLQFGRRNSALETAQ